MLVPSLDIGEAEIDLLRNLPVLDRSRFASIVTSLLDQGTLSPELSNAVSMLLHYVWTFRRAEVRIIRH